jgi:hypothetical protein
LYTFEKKCTIENCPPSEAVLSFETLAKDVQSTGESSNPTKKLFKHNFSANIASMQK